MLLLPHDRARRLRSTCPFPDWVPTMLEFGPARSGPDHWAFRCRRSAFGLNRLGYVWPPLAGRGRFQSTRRRRLVEFVHKWEKLGRFGLNSRISRKIVSFLT